MAESGFEANLPVILPLHHMAAMVHVHQLLTVCPASDSAPLSLSFLTRNRSVGLHGLEEGIANFTVPMKCLAVLFKCTF